MASVSPENLPHARPNGTALKEDQRSPAQCGTERSLTEVPKLSNRYRSTTEADELLSNLDNYIALGCLCFESTDNRDSLGNYLADWHDIADLPAPLKRAEIFPQAFDSLSKAGWIRTCVRKSTLDHRFLVYRVYLLPHDVGHRFVDRQNRRLATALEDVISRVDVSPSTWLHGAYKPSSHAPFDMFASKEEGSLFWMFNKLPSPSPSVRKIQEKYAREALEDLLDSSNLPGLATNLYAYQRRAAGIMLQRESVPTLELDPRLEPRLAPDGRPFYFSARSLSFFSQVRFYEATKGGILAESMGLGKTLMCLALILATKHHPPKVPAEHNLLPTRSGGTAALSDMAVSAIHRKAVPWRVEFDRIRHSTGDIMARCQDKLQNPPASYEIPQEPVRWNRKTILPPPKKLLLASTTLIVVPRNLCKQWQTEIERHVEPGALRVLIMDDPKKKNTLPAPDELSMYDVVLFSRPRFEREIRDGEDDKGRRIGTTSAACRCPYIGATRIRDCVCTKMEELYDSPLKHLHFKRIIVDEGHCFSNSDSQAVTVANKLVTADHRWVVSGTPAKDLMGVEVNTSAAENLSSRDAVLELRHSFSSTEDTKGAIKNIKSLASSFLKIKPWTASAGEEKADWDDYIYRHEDTRKKTFSGFSTCLRRTLENVVVKTQPEDVERDLDLPPVSHRVVLLEPTFYDKLTANLFTLVLTANAITSERTDIDYLFHRNASKARYQLITNLRQSAFFWTGFSEEDVAAFVKNSSGYLEKKDTNCAEEDRHLLTEALQQSNTFLSSEGWKALSRSHEIGLFVQDWPQESAKSWSFDPESSPLLTGVSQLLDAQKYINQQIGSQNVGEGLRDAGDLALVPARNVVTDGDGSTDKPTLTKSGIPTSSIDGEPPLKRRRSALNKSPNAKAVKRRSIVKKPESTQTSNESGKSTPNGSGDGGFQLGQKRPHPDDDTYQDLEERLPVESPYLKSRIIGTTSAKLSYLISQILEYHEHEKILVFYDGENIAYYIAQVLELLHIKHEIYAKSLAPSLKAEYVVRFDQETQDRVLLMDVKQAAFGLNLSSASRIYFVNPVCRPDIEAQAIKRAHRIGQAKNVYVETLVLKNALEEKMLERSKRMTRSEHNSASHLEDDGGIQKIIQDARILPIRDGEKTGYEQMAPLFKPQQLWSRPGWRDLGTKSGAGPPPEKRLKTKRKSYEIGESDNGGVTNGACDDHQPSSTPNTDARQLAYTYSISETPVPSLLKDSSMHHSDDNPVLVRWYSKSVNAGAPIATKCE